MAITARKLEAENPMEARLARLEERTEHIQSDVSEIKGDIRGLRDSVAALMEKMSSIETSMIKWMVGTLIAAVTSAFAIAKFFG
jgi:uncharacterized coiled-coil protein SlyX